MQKRHRAGRNQRIDGRHHHRGEEAQRNRPHRQADGVVEDLAVDVQGHGVERRHQQAGGQHDARGLLHGQVKTMLFGVEAHQQAAHGVGQNPHQRGDGKPVGEHLVQQAAHRTHQQAVHPAKHQAGHQHGEGFKGELDEPQVCGKQAEHRIESNQDGNGHKTFGIHGCTSVLWFSRYPFPRRARPPRRRRCPPRSRPLRPEDTDPQRHSAGGGCAGCAPALTSGSPVR